MGGEPAISHDEEVKLASCVITMENGGQVNAIFLILLRSMLLKTILHIIKMSAQERTGILDSAKRHNLTIKKSECF